MRTTFLFACATSFTMALALSVSDQQSGSKKTPVPAVDAYGDPLPDGALARIGAPRFRHQGRVETRAMAFSPDDKILAANTQNGIVLWDADTGKELRRFQGYSSGPIAFSPDGKSLALNAGQVILFDVATGKELFSVPQVGMRSSSTEVIRFSPDGKTIAMSYFCDYPDKKEGDLLKLLDAQTGKELFDLSGHSCGGFAFTPDSKILAVHSRDPGLRLYDVATGKFLRGIKLFDDRTYNPLAFAPDGKMLARGTKDGPELIDIDSGKVRVRLPADCNIMYSIAFSPDGRSLFGYDARDKLHVWEVRSHNKRLEIHAQSGSASAAALSSDCKTVAIGAQYSSSIRLWDLQSGVEKFASIQHTFGPINSVAFSPDGKSVATAAGNRHVHLWDADTGKHAVSFKGGSAKQLAFSADGKHLAAVGDDTHSGGSSARVWNAANGELAFELPKLHPKEQFVHVAFFPDGKQILTGNWNSDFANDLLFGPSIQVWEATTQNRIHRIGLDKMYPGCLAITSDGKSVAVGGQSTLFPDRKKQFLRLVDVSAEGKTTHLMGHDEAVTAVAFLPSGKLLASSSNDKTLRLWERSTAKEVLNLPSDQPVTAVAFSPDGRYLASSEGSYHDYTNPQTQNNMRLSDVNLIRIRNAATGAEILTRKYGVGITSLAFSPDGSRLVSGHTDGTALIWDVKNLK